MAIKNENALKDQKLAAEIELLKYRSAKESIQVQQERIALRLSQSELNNNKAQADANRVYRFTGLVTEDSIARCVKALDLWTRRDPNKPITIVFNSPGGDVFDGLALYDVIKELRESGHHVTTVARGMAASMGGVLLQAGNERIIGKNAWMMIHEVSGMSYGKTSEVEEQNKFAKRVQDRLLDILAERSTLTKKKIGRNWKKTDWWLDADEVVKLGFADKVG